MREQPSDFDLNIKKRLIFFLEKIAYFGQDHSVENVLFYGQVKLKSVNFACAFIKSKNDKI